LDWTREKVEDPSHLLLPVETLLATNFHVMKATVELLIENLKVLNDHVAKHTWLVGRFFSIADVVAALTIAPLFTDLLGKNHIKPFGSLLRWLTTVLDQPGVGIYYGRKFELCKNTPIPVNAPKKVKKDKNDDEESDEKTEIAPDVAYLFDIQTTMDINAWKTKYANTNPTKPEATTWFWENYDPHGYCLYFFHYKFFAECTIKFKTNNLFGGFLQRSDAIKGMARASCASMVIVEKEGLFHIYGVWLFKGTEMPAPWVQNIDDINYYEWERVDHNNAEHRALVDDYWAQSSDTEFGGRGPQVGEKTYGL